MIFYLREFCSLDTNSIKSLMSQSNWCHKNVWIYYYYDILIFSIEEIDHVNYVKQILERLRKFKLYASLKKYEFFITKMNFLKFIIFTKSVLMNSSRIDIIKTWFKSKMYWKIQVFLRFINFYRHFIHHYF